MVKKPTTESRSNDAQDTDSLKREIVRELTAKALAGSQEALLQFSRFVSDLALRDGLPAHFKAFLSLNGVCAGDIRALALAAIEANRRLESGELTRSEAKKLKVQLDHRWESIRLTADLIRQAAEQKAAPDHSSQRVGHA